MEMGELVVEWPATPVEYPLSPGLALTRIIKDRRSNKHRQKLVRGVA